MRGKAFIKNIWVDYSKAYVMIECVLFGYSKTAARDNFKGLTDDACNQIKVW